jgi:hypothetical protein
MNRIGLRIIAVALALAAAGCVAQPIDDAETSGAITRAPATTQDPWIVSIHAGDKGCTASVLSRHWLLTAAHCATVPASSTLDVAEYVAPSGLRHLYSGPARYYPNPAWNPTCPLGVCADTDADNDIGLIFVSGGVLDLAITGQARLFDDEEEPYHGAGSRSFRIIGYGQGTDPGGSANCSDGADRQKRIGSGFLVDVSGDNFQAHATYGDTHPCPGDSGAPWLFARGPAGGTLDLAFGVMSSMRPDLVVVGPKMWSALVRPRFGFIVTTSAASDYPLDCHRMAVGSWGYRRCDEPLILAPRSLSSPE